MKKQEKNTIMQNHGKTPMKYEFDNIDSYKFIDIHYHVNPDMYLRRYNAIQAGEIYKKHQGAVVLKSHLGSTVQSAMIAQDLGLPVFPSLTLNKIAGGVSIETIQRSLYEYRSNLDISFLVHLPTITQNHTHKPKVKRTYSNKYMEKVGDLPEFISESSKLKGSVIDILKFAKDNQIVVSTGHSSYDEIMLLIEACNSIGYKKLLLNQPANPISGFNYEKLKAIESEDIWIEQTLLTYKLGYQDWDDISSTLYDLSNVIYSSDFGQISQPDIDNWVLETHEIFSKIELSEKRKKEILLENPLKLLKKELNI